MDNNYLILPIEYLPIIPLQYFALTMFIVAKTYFA